MQPHRGGGLIEGFSEPEWTQRWHRQGCAARDKWVGLVAGNTDEMLHARVVRFQIGIADGPIGQSRISGQHVRSPPLAHMTQWSEVVRVEAAQPGTVVDNRATHSIHHLAERKRRRPGWLVGVAAPARRLIQELGAHARAAVVGGAELIRNEVLSCAPRARLQGDHPQAGTGEDRCNQSAHRPQPDEHHISRARRRLGSALRLESRQARLSALNGQAEVGERLDDASLVGSQRAEVFVGRVFQPHAGMAEYAPTRLVAVTAVGRIGEEPFLQVRPQELEEGSTVGGCWDVCELVALEACDQRILCGGCALDEGLREAAERGLVERGEAGSVGRDVLRFGAGEGSVEVGDDADVGCARAVLISGEEALEGGRDGARLLRVEHHRVCYGHLDRSKSGLGRARLLMGWC